MKLGAWIHDYSDEDLEAQINAAAQSGLASIRSYSLGYSQKVGPIAKAAGIELLAGISVDGPELAADWRSQVKLDELEATTNVDCGLTGLCVGNELREGGDEPGKKKFTARHWQSGHIRNLTSGSTAPKRYFMIQPMMSSWTIFRRKEHL